MYIMTGRTHDLAAFTALSYVLVTYDMPQMSVATAIVAFTANMIGALAPDIDQPTADLYRRVRGGTLISKLVSPLFGGHRFISHSILGVFIFGYLARFVLTLTGSVLIVDADIVWWAFMIGYISHLCIDMLTKEGVPWLFPIPFRFGIPPLRAFRVKTGEMVEKSLIFPGLAIATIYLYYSHTENVLEFLRKNIIR